MFVSSNSQHHRPGGLQCRCSWRTASRAGQASPPRPRTATARPPPRATTPNPRRRRAATPSCPPTASRPPTSSSAPDTSPYRAGPGRSSHSFTTRQCSKKRCISIKVIFELTFKMLPWFENYPSYFMSFNIINIKRFWTCFYINTIVGFLGNYVMYGIVC